MTAMTDECDALCDDIERDRDALRQAWDDHHDAEQAEGLWCDRNDLLIRIEKLRAEVKRLTPREITTVVELEALPNGGVIRSDEGCIWEKDISGWYEPGSRHEHIASDLALPAAVLYLPEGGE
ncbi:hypothetical protein EF294_03345 [Gordonia oryzae]|uniref:Uncharacterized protein n=1 Tax=Gordonia oryzae TaxID=2487349 RepID=A0A3N4GTY0_9ACTN|nr:hypothetical protein [Gordonia oryzae]RPA65785.1 hypothetical protein EF294_03345 [Gordonia oryzae]